jgi:hypothetical protein
MLLAEWAKSTAHKPSADGVDKENNTTKNQTMTFNPQAYIKSRKNSR